MAQRDRAQGFGFMYADISKLIAKKKDLEKDEAFTPVSSAEVKTANFNRDPHPITEARAASTPSPEFMQDRTAAIHQIRQNLDRLQTLHHKLHSMLEELNKIADREKKRKPD